MCHLDRLNLGSFRSWEEAIIRVCNDERFYTAIAIGGKAITCEGVWVGAVCYVEVGNESGGCLGVGAVRFCNA